MATIWTEPLEEKDKPAVKFTRGIHTPIARSKSYDYRYLDIEKLSLKERIEVVNLYIPIFDVILKTIKFGQSGRGYEKNIQLGSVPSKYLFQIAETKGAVVIGKYPQPEEIPEALRNKIWDK